MFKKVTVSAIIAAITVILPSSVSAASLACQTAGTNSTFSYGSCVTGTYLSSGNVAFTNNGYTATLSAKASGKNAQETVASWSSLGSINTNKDGSFCKDVTIKQISLKGSASFYAQLNVAWNGATQSTQTIQFFSTDSHVQLCGTVPSTAKNPSWQILVEEAAAAPASDVTMVVNYGNPTL
jgi:hypothetical protein